MSIFPGPPAGPNNTRPFTPTRMVSTLPSGAHSRAVSAMDT